MDASSDNTARFVIKEEKFILRPALERLSKADPANVLEVAAYQTQLIHDYHREAIAQAGKSLWGALIASVIALLFFLSSIGLILFQQPQSAAVISLISGALVQFISAINFYLYGRTSKQFAEFQSRLDTTQRFLIANSICEGLKGDFKQQARIELVRAIAKISNGAEERGADDDGQQ